jgi:hypothetical protein
MILPRIRHEVFLGPFYKHFPPPRKLRVTWTPELAQDLIAYQGINALDELAEIVGQEIINNFLNGEY